MLFRVFNIIFWLKWRKLYFFPSFISRIGVICLLFALGSIEGKCKLEVKRVIWTTFWPNFFFIVRFSQLISLPFENGQVAIHWLNHVVTVYKCPYSIALLFASRSSVDHQLTLVAHVTIDEDGFRLTSLPLVLIASLCGLISSNFSFRWGKNMPLQHLFMPSVQIWQFLLIFSTPFDLDHVTNFYLHLQMQGGPIYVTFAIQWLNFSLSSSRSHNTFLNDSVDNFIIPKLPVSKSQKSQLLGARRRDSLVSNFFC